MKNAINDMNKKEGTGSVTNRDYFVKRYGVPEGGKKNIIVQVNLCLTCSNETTLSSMNILE